MNSTIITSGWTQKKWRIGIAAIAAVLFATTLGCALRGNQERGESTESKPNNGAMHQAMNTNHRTETATLAGGCFWCIEAVFDELKGVDTVVSGYSGGQRPNPSYEQVCTGVTGHAESVQITFDPDVISFRDLLHVFFTVHDPTTLNQQGADVGTQYRSAIFYHSPEQKKAAEEVIAEFNAKHVWDDPIVTEVTPFTNFYPAEDYHQQYYANNPQQGYCRVVIAPKVAKFRKEFVERLKK
jgi:peptide-methionine (S)-S-oxide reductase